MARSESGTLIDLNLRLGRSLGELLLHRSRDTE